MIEVILAAPLLTVQDTGRVGRRHLGVPRCGMLDVPALQKANLLLGNPLDAAGLEITFAPVRLKALADHHIVLMGTDLQARLFDADNKAGQVLVPGFVHAWPAGHTLHLAAAPQGVGRACLAIAGGIDVPLVLGSRSTDLANRFGGLEGRALITGDTLPVGQPDAGTIPVRGVRQPVADGQLRVLPGPDYAELSAADRDTLWHTSWRVGAASNRMGLRLDGTPLTLVDAGSRLSYGVLPGQIQVPADGCPIVLAADAQTTGGYPCIGSVVSADLWQLAYLTPGAFIRFVEVDLPTAQYLRQHQAAHLQWLVQHLRGAADPLSSAQPRSAQPRPAQPLSAQPRSAQPRSAQPRSATPQPPAGGPRRTTGNV